MRRTAPTARVARRLGAVVVMTVVTTIVTFACGGVRLAEAAEVDLADLDARVEYAYYAADLRALEALAREHEALGASERPWAAYQYAHLQFRLLRLRHDAGDASGSARAAAACGQSLESGGTPDTAERDLLQATCAAYGDGPGARRVTRLLAAATAAAPKNPRVALAELYRAVAVAPRAPTVAQRRDLLARARSVAALFAEPSVVDPGAPSWGGAEAWLLVGSRAEALGDWLQAREAYEQCLVLAPDYALAARRLASLRERAQ